MNRVKNLIFDLDGTLIDSSEGVVEAVNYSLEKVGAPPQTPDAIKPYIGYPLEKMYPNFTDAPVDELCAHFQEKATETVVSSTVSLPGVDSTLRELCDRGYRLAIATTKIKVHVNGIIDKFGWQDRFAVATGGDEVEQVKPDPTIFLLTLERLKAPKSESMAIGDTINDVIAARAVPLMVTAVLSPYGGREKLMASGPDYFIENLPELLPLLDGSCIETRDQR